MAIKKSKPKAAKKKPAKPAKPAKRVSRPRPSKPGKPGPVNEWLELRGSVIHGLGGFARKEIPKGTRIIEYRGEKISNAESDRRYDDSKMKEHHTVLFILNKKQCIDAAYGGNEARFINHSCAPNCEVIISRGRIWMEAGQTIPAGTEILYDYDYDDDPKYTDDDYRFYVCQCGAAKCRGTIVNTKKKFKR